MGGVIRRYEVPAHHIRTKAGIASLPLPNEPGVSNTTRQFGFFFFLFREPDVGLHSTSSGPAPQQAQSVSLSKKATSGKKRASSRKVPVLDLLDYLGGMNTFSLLLNHISLYCYVKDGWLQRSERILLG